MAIYVHCLREKQFCHNNFSTDCTSFMQGNAFCGRKLHPGEAKLNLGDYISAVAEKYRAFHVYAKGQTCNFGQCRKKMCLAKPNKNAELLKLIRELGKKINALESEFDVTCKSLLANKSKDFDKELGKKDLRITAIANTRHRMVVGIGTGSTLKSNVITILWISLSRDSNNNLVMTWLDLGSFCNRLHLVAPYSSVILLLGKFLNFHNFGGHLSKF